MKDQVGTNAVARHGMEDGRYYCETVFHDDSSLDQNQRIRNSGMLEKGRLGLHDNEDIRMTISCPSTLQWSLFKSQHPETYVLLKSSDESERVRGARQLQILKPAWVVQSRL